MLTLHIRTSWWVYMTLSWQGDRKGRLYSQTADTGYTKNGALLITSARFQYIRMLIGEIVKNDLVKDLQDDDVVYVRLVISGLRDE